MHAYIRGGGGGHGNALKVSGRCWGAKGGSQRRRLSPSTGISLWSRTAQHFLRILRSNSWNSQHSISQQFDGCLSLFLSHFSVSHLSTVDANFHARKQTCTKKYED